MGIKTHKKHLYPYKRSAGTSDDHLTRPDMNCLRQFVHVQFMSTNDVKHLEPNNKKKFKTRLYPENKKRQ